MFSIRFARSASSCLAATTPAVTAFLPVSSKDVDLRATVGASSRGCTLVQPLQQRRTFSLRGSAHADGARANSGPLVRRFDRVHAHPLQDAAALLLAGWFLYLTLEWSRDGTLVENVVHLAVILCCVALLRDIACALVIFCLYAPSQQGRVKHAVHQARSELGMA